MPERCENSSGLDLEDTCLLGGESSGQSSTPSAAPSDSWDVQSGRPVSQVSTLSSGSASSHDEVVAPPPGGELSPAHSPLGRGSIAPRPQPSYLDRVVMEILETERTYVCDLRMIVEDYLSHIIDHADVVIRPEQVCALFGNIEDIYEFNSELLQSLESCANDPVAVARCFVMKSEYFEIYTQYCTNYPNSVAALTECMRNKSMARLLWERQASLQRCLPLGSYLLKPVQRILKYHLLLQEIAKHFDPADEGYDVIEEAIFSMTAVAWYINDMKRKHEHAVRLQEVQSLLLSWSGPDLTSYGELVLEGTFRVQRARNDRTLFLLERMLLICKRRGEHFLYKTHITCSTLMLIDSARDSLCFSVTHFKHPKQPITVQARTLEEKRLWTHHIKRIILENHHAVIPQKAKEAILEMDSIYPAKFRYSPDKMKKTQSGQSADSTHGNLDPEQSEPVKSLQKKCRASSKPADSSESEAPPPHLGEAEAPPPRLAEAEAPPPRLAEADSPKEKEEEEFLNKQVADFASSLLEVFSSWALLSTGVSMEKGPEQPAETLQTGPGRGPGSGSGPGPGPGSGTGPGPGSGPGPGPGSGPGPDPGPFYQGASEPAGRPLGEEGEAPPAPRPLGGADSSDEGEGEGEGGLLPSSVLDQAGTIAQHCSVRSGSLAADGCLSPLLPSRTGSIFKGEPDCRLRLLGAGPEVPEGNLSPRDGPLEAGGRNCTLSRQDQLLIGKIRGYYEAAESRDASFGLKRRESLSAIPPGLVRSSVCVFDSSDAPLAPLAPLGPLGPLAPGPEAAEPGPPGDPSNPGALISAASREQGAPEEAELLGPTAADDGFRPSSDMVRVWQAMELSLCPGPRRRQARPQQAITPSLAGSSASAPSADTLATISEEGLTPLQLSRPTTLVGDEAQRTPVPRVLQLRAEADRPPAGTEQNSRVLHLARQYSQRLRTGPAWRGGRQLPCLGEQETPDKTNLTLTLNLDLQIQCPAQAPDQAPGPGPAPDQAPGRAPDQVQDQAPAPDQAPGPDQVQDQAPAPDQAPGPDQASGQVESFIWPDVRQLRSRYVGPGGGSVSALEGAPARTWRRHSSSCMLSREGPEETLRRPGGGVEAGARLTRTTSLEPRGAGRAGCHGYYVWAEAPLPGGDRHEMVFVEILPEAKAEEEDQDEDQDEDLDEDQEEDQEEQQKEQQEYVEIRSPTSREKICIMTVIDRCRAYQASDQYRQREEGGARQDTRPPPTNKAHANEAHANKAHANEACASKACTNEACVNKAHANKAHANEAHANEACANKAHANEACANEAHASQATEQNVVKSLREKFQNLR